MTLPTLVDPAVLAHFGAVCCAQSAGVPRVLVGQPMGRTLVFEFATADVFDRGVLTIADGAHDYEYAEGAWTAALALNSDNEPVYGWLAKGLTV